MGIKNIVTAVTGEIGFSPNLARIECTDSLSDITTANYLTPFLKQGYNFKNGDFVLINSSAQTSSGVFQVVLENNEITLDVVALTTARLASNKESCLCATTETLIGDYDNGPNDDGIGATFTFTATGIQVIDGTSLQMDSISGPFRILVKNGQTNRRGIYELTRDGATGIQCQLTRAPDFNNISNVNQGDFTLVVGGNENGGTIWYEFLSGPFVIGYSTLQFSQAGGSSSSDINYVESDDGITLTNNIPLNVVSMTLPSGTWMVFGSIGYANSGGSMTQVQTGISITSATFPDEGLMIINTGTLADFSASVPMQIVTSSGTRIVYLVADATFTGTNVVFGGLNVVKV